jgi:uncharacterized protein YfaS (alpha-2-macroglobulin family)
MPARATAKWLITYVTGDYTEVVSVDSATLSPTTTYELTVGPGLTDIYGQVLGKTVSGSCNTGDFNPDFQAAAGNNIIVPGSGFTIDIGGLNLPERRYGASYRVMKPEDLVYLESANPQYSWMLPAFHRDQFEVLPDPSAWGTHRLRARQNQPAMEHIDVPGRLGGPYGLLAYGVRANIGDPNNQPTFYGFAHITNLSVFQQWFPEAGFVRIHHLSDGAPVAGARIDIYPSKLGADKRPASRPCARGNTDGSGTAAFDSRTLAGCMSGRTYLGSSNEGPALLAVAHEGDDWAYARSSTWNSFLYAGWEVGAPISRGTIFSDRNLYRPDEMGWFTLEAYYLLNGAVHQDKNARYRVTMTGPNNTASSIGICATNAFGACSFSIKFKHGQSVGYYDLKAMGPNGVEITGHFRVAEFKAPNFKVALSLDRKIALVGDTVRAFGQSDYLFGYPVDRAVSKFFVTRAQTYFHPEGWSDFTFGRRWFWPDYAPTIKSDVLRTTQPTDRSGKAVQAIFVVRDLPYPTSYSVDLETTDASNLSVAASKSFTALPSNELIGVSADWSAREKKQFSAKIVVVDWRGKPLTNRRVIVRLQSITYKVNAAAYKTEQKIDITSGTTPKEITLVAPSAGSYRVHANFAGARSETHATDQQVWVTGEEPFLWGYGDDPLTITLNKSSYAPGETARASV